MKDYVLAVRVNEDELKEAKKWCADNTTSLQLQINKLIKELAEKNKNRSEG